MIRKKRSLQKHLRVSAFMAWSICFLGILFYCYEFFLRIEPSVMIPQLMRSFDIGAGELGMLAAFFYVAYTPMQLVVGVLTDVVGPRLILTVAVIFCVVGSFIFGASDVFYLAAAGRFLIGFGAAFAFVGALKLAVIWLPPERFALFAGFATALGMFGAMVGDVELAVLVHSVGWREVIWIGTAFGLILIPLIWFFVRNHREPVNIHPPQTLRGIKKVLMNHQLWLCGTIAMLLYFSLSIFAVLWSNAFFKTAYDLTSKQSAFLTSMVFLGWLIGAPFFGWFTDYIKTRRLPIIIGACLAAVLIAIVLFVPNIPFVLLHVILVLFGFCCSAQVICFAIGKDLSPKGNEGLSVSFVNMVTMLGGLIFQPLVGWFLDLGWDGIMRSGVHVFAMNDYRTALIILPIGLVIGAVLTLILRETYGSHRT